ncbi:hypothetical protein CPS_3061 [Colwellia psychrerythraea 34H]|uniref:Uncharacterized protein n=1 Tax=Colwellia psychrerythraea (strain 34H / ATCC BAA-681) TaxID=167879 RepID=Q47ZL1_COLP3|nr:hypothetical protein CPS_3061 [Colwellia psychrerythraea 34H]
MFFNVYRVRRGYINFSGGLANHYRSAGVIFI